MYFDYFQLKGYMNGENKKTRFPGRNRLFVSPAYPQYLAVVRIENYGLKESNDQIAI
jgi:hypothetical protein